MSEQVVLILGGGSDIGMVIARRFAAEGFDVQLAARNPERLEAERADIALRNNITASLHPFDVTDLARTEDFFDTLPALPRVVVSVIGLLGDQDETAGDVVLMQRTVMTNFTGPAWALECAARRLAVLSHKTAVIGVTSVAGDRGRAKNYWYGAAKSGLTVMLSGLRQKYARTELRVIELRPGFVATRMTEGMDLPGPLTAAPDELGESAWRAWEKDRARVYVRRIWWLVMTIICAVPERIFKRMSF